MRYESQIDLDWGIETLVLVDEDGEVLKDIASMGEPEDRYFYRDGRGAVKELNRLLQLCLDHSVDPFDG